MNADGVVLGTALPGKAAPGSAGNEQRSRAASGRAGKLLSVLRKAAQRALGGGLAGALAMVAQVLLLMWLRTTMNYQYSKGLGTLDAMRELYAEGGVPRFYRGLWAALLAAPLSRFGDTAANAGTLALLEDVPWLSEGFKTFFASCAAALFRILITPIDTIKTILQVQGAVGMAVLSSRIAQEGFLTLYSGALANSLATLLGHYPWFLTNNWLESTVPRTTGAANQLRSAGIGFVCSAVSDVASNSVRVVKTYKQTAEVSASYIGAAMAIVEADGLSGLFLRGLGTKVLTNGISAMLFTILWKEIEKGLAARRSKAKAQ